MKSLAIAGLFILSETNSTFTAGENLEEIYMAVR